MTKEEIFEIVLKPSFLNCFPLEESEITLDSNMKKDLNLDSLDMLDLLSDIEERFGSGEELVSSEEEKQLFYGALFGTVSDLVDVFHKIFNDRKVEYNEPESSN